MADQPGPVDAQLVHDADDIRCKRLYIVVLNTIRPAGAAEPALVRDNDPVTGIRHRLYLVAPYFPGIREAVQEHDGRAFSVHGDRELQAIDRQGGGMRGHVEGFYCFLLRRASLAAQ